MPNSISFSDLRSLLQRRGTINAVLLQYPSTTNTIHNIEYKVLEKNRLSKKEKNIMSCHTCKAILYSLKYGLIIRNILLDSRLTEFMSNHFKL